MESDSSPRVLLLPDSLPKLHSIYPAREDESNPEDVLSTVDIAALNELPGADPTFQMGNTWRSTAPPRRREKPVETFRNEKQKPICNGLKAPCHSEESQESEASNSDSDSDSECSKSCSSSSSSDSTSCSSTSGSSSDSDTGDESSKSNTSQVSKSAAKVKAAGRGDSSPSVPLVNGGNHSKPSTKETLHRSKKLKKDYGSSSDSRSSSRERKSKMGVITSKRKTFSVSNAGGEGIKLRLAALKPPVQQSNENYMTETTQPTRVSSSWLSEESSNDGKTISPAVERPKNKPVKTSPSTSQQQVPETSPQKKSMTSSNSNSIVDKKSLTSTSSRLSPATEIKSSPKSNNLCKTVSPDKQKVSVESPKKKNKLSCLMTSLSPKGRVKTNGTLLVNGNQCPVKEELKFRSPTASPLKQNYASHSQKSVPAPLDVSNSPQGQIQSPKKFHNVNVKPPISVPSAAAAGASLNHQSNYSMNSYGSGQITTPVKTKAAKKYIPDDHLVIPAVVVTPPTPQSSAKQKKPNDDESRKRKRKIKKSSSKDKKKAKKKQKIQKKTPELEGYKEVCVGITNINLNVRGELHQMKPSEAISWDAKEPFTFARRKYTNFEKELSSIQIPIPNTTRNSFPRTPIASSSGSGRKRKVHIVNDRMKEASQSNQLQRLPLKKRHHHTSPMDKNSSKIFPNAEQKFSDLPNFKPTEIKTPLFTQNVYFKWKKESGPLFNFADVGVFKTEESRNQSSTRGQKSSAGKKQSMPKKKQISPDITAPPAAATATERRSGRIRRPTRKIDSKESTNLPSNNNNIDNQSGEIPEKTNTVNKRLINKRETRKNKAELVNNENNEASIGDEKETAKNTTAKSVPLRETRKRTMPTPITATPPEIPYKRIKFKPEIECDNSLGESDISTDAGTDAEEACLQFPPPPSSDSITPVASPRQQQQQLGRKRRKVNRTGFPSVKKKRKSGAGAGGKASSRITLRTPNASGSEDGANPVAPVVAKEELELSILAGDIKEEIVDDESKEQIENEASSIPNAAAPGFSLSLTERVKMRKRISLDSRLSLSDGQGSETKELGFILDLVDLPNPPLVVPVKDTYLPCGLLSNYYKCMDVSSRTRSELEKQNPLLPLPPDGESGEFTTTTIREYRLPFDIWTLAAIRSRNIFEQIEEKKREEAAAAAAAKKEEARMTGRKSEVVTEGVTRSGKPKRAKMPDIIPPSWSFKKIKSNSYFGGKPSLNSNEFEQSCICSEGPHKCSTDDCLNRVVYTECPSTCGDNCKNHRIQRHDWAPGIKRLLTQDKGYGVFTLEQIKKGDFILEYVGEVVTEAVFKERMQTIYVGDTHHYCLHLDGGLVIDGHRAGGEGRFVNHSCEPNCEMQKWSVNGLSRMALFALRDIEPNEELSYDYNFSLFNPSEGQPCYCGSEKCRGVIGVRSKNGKNGDGNGNGKRGQGNGAKDANGTQDNSTNDQKMKHLNKKDKNFVQTHNCFLIRNYEKIRKIRYEVEDKVNIGDKLEKIMTAWTTRFKARSSKNKPPQVPEDDPKLSRLAKISQIFYELFAELTTAKDESGAVLCQPFMICPSKKRFPQLHANEDSPLDFSQIGKKILRGEYRTMNTFEADLGRVMSNFEVALEKDKPGISENIRKIKKLYKDLKVDKVELLEPFIVHKGSKGSTISNELPRFKEIAVDPRLDDVIRCVCDRFSDEGTMIQCDRCSVWQHVDCMRVPHTAARREQRNSKRQRTQQRRNKFFSPVKTTASASGLVRSTSCIFPLGSPSYGNNSLSAASSNSSLPNTPVKSRINSRPLRSPDEDVVIMADLILNVKDEIPMEIKDDSNHSNDVPQAEVACITAVDISEMETQRIDVDGDLEMNRPPPDLIIREGVQSSSADSPQEEQPYYCERCDQRPVDKEVRCIEMDTEQEPDRFHYTTLVRDDGFKVRRNDTVYVLRDPPSVPGQIVIDRPTYKTAGPLVPKDCDIFRIENLWKDEAGKRFAYGHHFVRPSETFHEHNRRFYKNEICRSPATEIISIDLIHGRCWVLDPITYCKGRPVGCEEEHVYICEFRVDKSNRSFSKVGKTTLAVCLKPFAFKNFETKIHITRNYHPHGPPSPDFKQKLPVAPAASTVEKGRARRFEDKTTTGKTQSMLQRLKSNTQRREQRERLKLILDGLQTRLPNFENSRVDLSNLLGRKKVVKKLNMSV